MSFSSPVYSRISAAGNSVAATANTSATVMEMRKAMPITRSMVS